MNSNLYWSKVNFRNYMRHMTEMGDLLDNERPAITRLFEPFRTNREWISHKVIWAAMRVTEELKIEEDYQQERAECCAELNRRNPMVKREPDCLKPMLIDDYFQGRQLVHG